MTRVTAASLAYLATQVNHSASSDQVYTDAWSQARFALTSSPTFTRTDTVTDSHRFYTTLLDVLEDPEEKTEVDELFVWWVSLLWMDNGRDRLNLGTHSFLVRFFQAICPHSGHLPREVRWKRLRCGKILLMQPRLNCKLVLYIFIFKTLYLSNRLIYFILYINYNLTIFTMSTWHVPRPATNVWHWEPYFAKDSRTCNVLNQF